MGQKTLQKVRMNITLKLVTLFVRIDDLCKEKRIGMRVGRGRPCRLHPSEIVTIYVWFMLSKVRSFKTFYKGPQGKFLRPFFPKMTTYTAFLKQLKKHSQKLWSLATDGDRSCRKGQKAYIDSTPLPVCENVRSQGHRVFAGMAHWAYSSTGTKFGLKMHLLVDENQKIRNFILKPGNLHDVSCAEEVLKNFRGTVMGDKGYCSEPLAKQLIRRKIRLISRHRGNMRSNTPEEKKLLQKRSLVETVIGKFKNFFGAKLSRFRSPQAAFSAICAGVLAVNLGC
jgi:IS5 family transposase